jgi:hypothetical protein
MCRILEEWYKPKTQVTLRQLQHQYNTIKMMDENSNMEKHLQKVEQLKRQIEEQGEKITDSSYISVLLNCAPSKYNMVINVLEAQADITSRIIINRLLEKYLKFQVGKEESAAKQALLTNRQKSANQNQGFQKREIRIITI